MNAYSVTNTTSGVVLGVYYGEDEDEALDSMARDQGYHSFDDLRADIGDTSDLDAPKINAPVELVKACEDMTFGSEGWIRAVLDYDGYQITRAQADRIAFVCRSKWDDERDQCEMFDYMWRFETWWEIDVDDEFEVPVGRLREAFVSTDIDTLTRHAISGMIENDRDREHVGWTPEQAVVVYLDEDVYSTWDLKLKPLNATVRDAIATRLNAWMLFYD